MTNGDHQRIIQIKVVTGINTHMQFPFIFINTQDVEAWVFFYSKPGGEGLRIGRIIKEKQPREFQKVTKGSERDNDLSFEDIEELMRHSSYKRGKGGAVRQVR